MSISTEKITGLLLQSIPYLGQKKILKILTPENGLLSCFATKRIDPILTTPFLLGEWVYMKNQRDIHPLIDATLIDDLSALKVNYQHLTTAGQIAQDLLRTQLPGKVAHEPLSLALACLRKLPLFQEPEILLATFRLKLLFLEGLLSFELPLPLTNLLLAKSFNRLASLPKEEQIYRQVDLLFEESLS
jgi:recombinational DNA repair protein (RecF pathway)